MHDAIANKISNQIHLPVLQEALIASAQLASETYSTMDALQKLFSQRLTLEYNDTLARHLIKKVVVLDEDRSEILFKQSLY